VYELLQIWLRRDTPVGAILLAFVMLGLRIAYGGGETDVPRMNEIYSIT
jgi:hypothetical protein